MNKTVQNPKGVIKSIKKAQSEENLETKSLSEASLTDRIQVKKRNSGIENMIEEIDVLVKKN